MAFVYTANIYEYIHSILLRKRFQNYAGNYRPTGVQYKILKYLWVIVMKASGTCSQGVLLDSKTPNALGKTRYPHFLALQIVQKGFSRLTNKRTGDILCFCSLRLLGPWMSPFENSTFKRSKSKRMFVSNLHACHLALNVIVRNECGRKLRSQSKVV